MPGADRGLKLLAYYALADQVWLLLTGMAGVLRALVFHQLLRPSPHTICRHRIDCASQLCCPGQQLCSTIRATQTQEDAEARYVLLVHADVPEIAEAPQGTRETQHKTCKQRNNAVTTACRGPPDQMRFCLGPVLDFGSVSSMSDIATV